MDICITTTDLVGFPFCCDLGSKDSSRLFFRVFSDEVH